MGNTSIRVRLTIWYGGGLALIMLLFATSLYLVMSRALQEQIDRSLEDAAVAAARSLEEHRFGPFLLLEDLAQAFPELALLDKFFQIFGPQGQITLQSANIKTREIPLSKQAMQAALKGKATFESVRFQDEVPIRLLSYPINHGDTLVNILRVGASLQPVESMLDRLVFVLQIGSPLAVLVSMFGGWFLAGRALRPVDTITDTAQRIAAGDLTQRIQTTSSDEIGRLASTFNDMIARLEASIRQIRQFSADASHELRTPVALIKGYASTLTREDANWDVATVKQSLGVIEDEADRLTDLIDDLLTASKIQAEQRINLTLSNVRLDQLAQQTVERQQTQTARHQFALGFQDDFPVIQGDAKKLRQVLDNLITNAIKYSPEGGTITIGGRYNAEQVTLFVRDEGEGIPETELERIFERFYRVDGRLTNRTKGTGLGLYLVKAIVEAHDGTIHVKSQPRQGSTFFFTLPRS